jgi:hypothetical protein
MSVMNVSMAPDSTLQNLASDSSIFKLDSKNGARGSVAFALIIWQGQF